MGPYPTAVATRPGLDLTDLYVFPNPTNAKNVVLALGVHPLIPSGQGLATIFDPNILYQFKIDNNGDFVEDLVIQAKFVGTGLDQTVQISGPLLPVRTGTVVFFNPPDAITGMINTPFTLSNGALVFAGAREDPSFFDQDAFWSVFPDRAAAFGPTFTNINGVQVSTSPSNPNAPQLASFRGQAHAQDFYKGTNVLAIVIDLPRAMLGKGVIRVWATTSDPGASCNNGPQLFTQNDRMGRPLVTELFATVANNRELTNITDNPTNDANQLKLDATSFLATAAGRSQALSKAVCNLFVPDVLVADLSQSGPASYLGVETKAKAGAGSFGGRALTDDPVDALLSFAFGNAAANLGLSPDDGRETPGLTTDNVGPNTAPKHFLATFPYIGAPQ